MTDNEQIRLEKNETIQWTGKPIKTKFLDEDVKSRYILELAITAAVCVFLIVGYLILCQKNDTEIMFGMIAIIILLTVLPVSSIFSVWFSLGKLTYVITNQRVMIWHSSNKVFALDLKNVDSITIVSGKNGMESLCIGSPTTKLPSFKLRSGGAESIRVTRYDNETLTYPVFYNIADANNAMSILKSLIT